MTIKKTKSGYVVKSKKTGKVLGRSKTKAGAVKRLRQIEYFKNR